MGEQGRGDTQRINAQGSLLLKKAAPVFPGTLASKDERIGYAQEVWRQMFGTDPVTDPKYHAALPSLIKGAVPNFDTLVIDAESQLRAQLAKEAAEVARRQQVQTHRTAQLQKEALRNERPRVLVTDDRIPYLSGVYNVDLERIGTLPVLYPQKDRIEPGSVIGYVAPDPKQPGTYHKHFGMVREIRDQQIIMDTTVDMANSTIQSNPDNGTQTVTLSHDLQHPRTIRFLDNEDFVPADVLRKQGIDLPKVEQ